MFCKHCGQETKIGSRFCANCGQEISVRRAFILKNRIAQWFKDHRTAIFVIFGFLIVLTAVGAYDGSSTHQEPVHQQISTQQTSSYDQEEVAASVVNIFCPSVLSEEESAGGSGTIVTEDGLVLTNSHIIPQDDVNLYVGDEGCLVILPNPTTGQADGMYLARPIVFPGLSDNYDLAFIQIYDAYYDNEEGAYAGVYPRSFPAFDDTTRCRDEDIQLGEPVRIFGYPAISGGISLTVTDGIISSLPGDGFIVTSAKISHGNSGGLAVDRYGCMIGIPSMVSTDEYESLGVIISTQLINEFTDQVNKYLEQS
jgi:hypothetical protein